MLQRSGNCELAISRNLRSLCNPVDFAQGALALSRALGLIAWVPSALVEEWQCRHNIALRVILSLINCRPWIAIRVTRSHLAARSSRGVHSPEHLRQRNHLRRVHHDDARKSCRMISDWGNCEPLAAEDTDYCLMARVPAKVLHESARLPRKRRKRRAVNP